MSESDGFLSSLLGIHDVQVNGGSLLARRHTLNIVNGLVEDVGGVTQISAVSSPAWLDTGVIAAQQDDYNPTGFASASEVPVSTVAARDITGFVSGGVVVYEKRIWNLSAGAFSVTLKHDDSNSAAGNRIFGPGGADVVIAYQTAAKLIWSPGDSHWKALTCSI